MDGKWNGGGGDDGGSDWEVSQSSTDEKRGDGEMKSGGEMETATI